MGSLAVIIIILGFSYLLVSVTAQKHKGSRIPPTPPPPKLPTAEEEWDQRFKDTEQLAKEEEAGLFGKDYEAHRILKNSVLELERQIEEENKYNKEEHLETWERDSYTLRTLGGYSETRIDPCICANCVNETLIRKIKDKEMEIEKYESKARNYRRSITAN